MLLRKCIECFKQTGHPVRLGIIDTTPGSLSSAFLFDDDPDMVYSRYAPFAKGIWILSISDFLVSSVSCSRGRLRHHEMHESGTKPTKQPPFDLMPR